MPLILVQNMKQKSSISITQLEADQVGIVQDLAKKNLANYF
jgi:hypothetical protein